MVTIADVIVRGVFSLSIGAGVFVFIMACLNARLSRTVESEYRLAAAKKNRLVAFLRREKLRKNHREGRGSNAHSRPKLSHERSRTFA